MEVEQPQGDPQPGPEVESGPEAQPHEEPAIVEVPQPVEVPERREPREPQAQRNVPQTVNWGTWGNPPANSGGCNNGWRYESTTSTCHADLSNPKADGCRGPHCRITPVNCNQGSRSATEKAELRKLHYWWGGACTDAPAWWGTCPTSKSGC